MLLSTTPSIEGKSITEYRGVVVGKDGSMMMVSVSGTAVTLS